MGGCIGVVLNITYPGRHSITGGVLDAQQTGQLMSAVDQMNSQRCQEVEEAVFLRSETKNPQ